MNLETLIQSLPPLGLRLNNLFQSQSGKWWANITDGTMFWDFGTGQGPVEALQAALEQARITRGGGVVQGTTAEASETSVEALGL